MAGIKYTESENQWIIVNIDHFNTIKEMWESFNTIFPHRGIEGFRTHITRLHIFKRFNNGQYGVRKKEECPIGTEKTIKRGSVYVKVKESGDKKITGYQYPYWVPKQRKIYEDHYGPIPDDHFVIFLNKNINDFDIDNLYCINRNILAIMNSNQWFTTNRQHTLTAIKLCELMYELKRRK